jgi:hypothetical protein
MRLQSVDEGTSKSETLKRQENESNKAKKRWDKFRSECV